LLIPPNLKLAIPNKNKRFIYKLGLTNFMANLGLMMEAEERSNETRAGTNLKLVEELTMLTAQDRFVYHIPGNAIDRDAFREEEEAKIFEEENTSVRIQNNNRVSLLIDMAYHRGMLETEETHENIYDPGRPAHSSLYGHIFNNIYLN